MVLCLGFGRYNNRRQIERNRNITQTFTVSFKLNLLEHLPCVKKLPRKTITPLQNLSILVLFFLWKDPPSNASGEFDPLFCGLLGGGATCVTYSSRPIYFLWIKRFPQSYQTPSRCLPVGFQSVCSCLWSQSLGNYAPTAGEDRLQTCHLRHERCAHPTHLE